VRALVFAAAVGSFVCGPAWGQECNTIESDAERLRCFDKQFPRASTAAVAGPESAASSPMDGTPPPEVGKPWTLPRFLQNFRLANETAPSGALRAEPAAFSYAKLNGTEYSTSQAALIWEPSESWFPQDTYLARNGWGPVASYSINRNSLPAKKSDVRQGAVGLYGVLFRIAADKEPGEITRKTLFGVLTKIDAAYRRNRVDDTKSMVYTIDNIAESRWLFDGIPYGDKFAWYLTPRFGLQAEDRQHVKSGNPKGETHSLFGQLKADLYPGMISDRMKVSLLIQRYVDLSAATGIDERHDTFSKAGVEFLLYPPRAAAAALQPSIALERSYGADLLNGLPRQGLTQLTFKLKVN